MLQAAFFPGMHYIFGKSHIIPDAHQLTPARSLVSRRRDCPTRWLFLRWTNPGHIDGKSNPSRCFTKPQRHQRPCRMAMDVHHLCHHHHPYWHTRLLRPSRHTRQTQQIHPHQQRHRSRPQPTKTRRARHRLQLPMEDVPRDASQLEDLGLPLARHLLLERLLQHQRRRLPPMAEESG